MGFLSDASTTFGICIGTIIVILIAIFALSAIMDFDPSTTIENNTTITLNGIKITVPQTSNYTINDNASLWHVNDTEKFGMNNNITKGNAWQYYDPEHNISIYVADSNRTAHSDTPDSSELTLLDGDTERTHIEKKTIGDKTIVMYVTEGKGLSGTIFL